MACLVLTVTGRVANRRCRLLAVMHRVAAGSGGAAPSEISVEPNVEEGPQRCGSAGPTCRTIVAQRPSRAARATQGTHIATQHTLAARRSVVQGAGVAGPRSLYATPPPPLPPSPASQIAIQIANPRLIFFFAMPTAGGTFSTPPTLWIPNPEPEP